MKKLFLSLALLGFLGCSNDLEENETSQVANEITMTVKDFKWENKQSKTSVDISYDGVAFNWAENDTVGIFPNEGAQAYFPMISGAGSNTATFTGGGWALKPSSTYAAYYPMQGKFYLDKTAIPVSYEGQTQIGNASTSHLSKYDYMTAVAQTPKQGKVNFNFEHLGCLIKLEMQFLPQENYKSITLSCNEPIFMTEGNIDLTAQSPTIVATHGKKTDKLTIELQNIQKSTEDLTNDIYFMAAPVDLSQKEIRVEIKSDNMIKKSSFIGKNWIAGKAISQTIIFEGENVKPTPIPTPGLWIDLGLSHKWASHNVGANKPEEYGDYFAWGEIYPKDSYSEENYEHLISYDKYGNSLYKDISICADPRYDAATANWGYGARMPIFQEFNELVNNCSHDFIELNGVNGILFTATNGNSIFLPANGAFRGTTLEGVGEHLTYWACDLFKQVGHEKELFGAFSLQAGKEGGYYVYWYYRFAGLCVRPVHD